METTNKKILNTKRTLRETLCILIKTKAINEITVSEVCREANINRTTFYKYYTLPIDILHEYIEEINERALEQLKKNQGASSKDELYQTMLAICRLYYENKPLMKVYMEFNKDLMPLIQGFIKANAEYGLKDNSLTYFIAGGVSSIIMQWGMKDFKQQPEEVAKILTKYILMLQPKMVMNQK